MAEAGEQWRLPAPFSMIGRALARIRHKEEPFWGYNVGAEAGIV